MVTKTNMQLYIIDIRDQVSSLDYSRCMEFVSPKVRDKINKFHFKEDSMRSLYGDILVRSLAVNQLRLSNAQLQFEYNPYGKRYLKGDHKFHFNVSHSGNYVLCGVDQNAIGVDIEVIKDGNCDIAKRFFSNHEYEELMSTDEERRNELFYRFWTLKESYIKYKGMGLSIPLNSFTFSLKNGNAQLVEPKELLYCKSLRYDEKHVIAVTSENYIDELSIKKVSIPELMNHM